MKQVLIQKGIAKICDLPPPKLNKGEILVAVQASTISIGTEVADIKNSAESLYQKAIKQPSKIIQTISYTSKFGIKKTYDYIRSRDKEFAPTGYSCAGVVIGISDDIKDISIGQKVACAGAKYAFHAEIIKVPRNLCVLISDDISFQNASTVSLGAIALQGIRRSNPTIGECFVVVGLGLIGQLTVQILKANGCRVIGIDKDLKRVDTALNVGLDYGFNKVNDVIKKVNELTTDFGADGVIITASSRTNDIISNAFNFCRKKGRVVLVGDVGLNLKREDFYKNEIDFLISTSYGPGRYDEEYEESGIDYPIGYVRWTENRNMQEYLRLIEEKKINLEPLIKKIFPIEKANEAYGSLIDNIAPIVVFLTYKKHKITDKFESKVELSIRNRKKEGAIGLGVVGTGDFAKSIHLPNIKLMKNNFHLVSVVNNSGVNSFNVGKMFQAQYITSSYEYLLNDPNVEAILISTRHDSHADLVLKALTKGKHVLVEKPLAINKNELKKIKEYYNKTDKKPVLFTGYNRRFSPHIIRLKDFIKSYKSPFILSYRVNAGHISNSNWVNKMDEGGGRNIGEACHFYDLFCFLAESKVGEISVHSINKYLLNNMDSYHSDLPNENFIVTIKFENQCICNLIYTSLGNKKIDKEYLELFIGNDIFLLKDYKELQFVGRKKSIFRTKNQDKGYKNELMEFFKAIKYSKNKMSIEDQLNVSEISFRVEEIINKYKN